MVQRFIVTAIAAIVLTTGAGSARSPKTLELDWFELPDAHPIDCEIRDGSDVECFSTSLEFKKFKKKLRKRMNRASRDKRIELSPWRKDGDLRRMSAIVGSVAVELVFNERRRAVAVITVPWCLDTSELGAYEPDELESEPEIIEKARDLPILSHGSISPEIVTGIIRNNRDSGDGFLSGGRLPVMHPADHVLAEVAVEGQYVGEPVSVEIGDNDATMRVNR